MRVALRVAYDGTDFSGWQEQPTASSVAGTLKACLVDCEPDYSQWTAAGRTDRGVHAVGQVMAVTCPGWKHGAERLGSALNARLPASIRITGAQEVPQSFHARFDARERTYCYVISEGELPIPTLRSAYWHVSSAVDHASLDECARSVIGTHDFAAVGIAPHGTNTVRTVTESMWKWEKREVGGLAIQVGTYTVTANAFLRGMVRHLVGGMVHAAQNPTMTDAIANMIVSPEGGRRIPWSAPPHGLYLWNVTYPNTVFNWNEGMGSHNE